MTASPAEALARLPKRTRTRHLAALDEDQLEAMLRSWHFWSRPEQRAPDELWRWWAMVTGRGFGKNRSGSEWTVDRCEAFARHRAPHHVGLLNRSFNHVRALQIQGESGLGAVCERRGYRLHHAATSLEGEIEVRIDGRWHTSTFEVHTADDPDRVRGRNFMTVHADEAAAWRHKQDAEGGTAFTNCDLGLRSICPPGLNPQGMVTTTPKPIALVRDLLAGAYGRTVITRGSLFDNASNLALGFIEAILRRYVGTRLGLQEIEGHLLEDVEGALWTWRGIEADRFKGVLDLAALDTIVIGVDPPGETAECGIVAVGSVAPGQLCPKCGRVDNVFRHAIVIEDASFQPRSAEEWAAEVVALYHRLGAHTVAAETNNGHDMVRAVIHNVDPMVRVEKVTASKAKRTRAEPVSALYDQHRVHHWLEWVDLEGQMSTWVPGDDSPDRMDALVWALTQLGGMLTSVPGAVGIPSGGGAAYQPHRS